MKICEKCEHRTANICGVINFLVDDINECPVVHDLEDEFVNIKKGGISMKCKVCVHAVVCSKIKEYQEYVEKVNALERPLHVRIKIECDHYVESKPQVRGYGFEQAISHFK